MEPGGYHSDPVLGSIRRPTRPRSPGPQNSGNRLTCKQLGENESIREMARVAVYTYRYLDPLTGRWTSRDPIEEEGGSNLFSSASNDLINLIDPLGTHVVGNSSECRNCIWTISGRHALSGPNWIGAFQAAAKEIAKKHPCGDKIGYATCAQQLANEILGQLAIPGLQNGFNSSGGYNLAPEDLEKVKEEMRKLGLDPSKFNLKGLQEELFATQPEETWNAAIKSAKEQCKSRSCCKSITVSMECSPDYKRNEAVAYAARNHQPVPKTADEADKLAKQLRRDGKSYCGRTEKIENCVCP